jgi:hypothetical protein
MSNNRPLLIIACVVLAVIGGTLWFLNTKQQPVPVSTTEHADIKVPIGPTLNLDSSGESTPAPMAKVATPKPAPAPKAEPRPMQEWEVRIDEVLRGNADETQTAQILINMLPTLPPDGQAEAAQHISNLITDDQYNRVLPLVKNPNLPEEVLDVFVTDLMNREDKVKLPTLLDIAKIPNHPHHEEALSDLEIMLDEDFESLGHDWGKLDQGVKAYLKKQATEDAAGATNAQ